MKNRSSNFSLVKTSELYKFTLIAFYTCLLGCQPGVQPGSSTVKVFAGPDKTVQEGDGINFEAVLTGSGTYTYKWNFGDGTVSNSQNPFHVFSNDGEYVATLEIFEGEQEVGQDTANITVLNIEPTFELTHVNEWALFVPFEISLSIDDPGAFDSHTLSIDWGDGQIDDISESRLNLRSLALTHSFESIGIYSVEITLADNGGGSSIQNFLIDVADRQIISLEAAIQSWALVGQELMGHLRATDTKDMDLSLELSVAPTGMVLDTNGTLTWTPDETHVGVHQITLAATDGTVRSEIQLSISISGVQNQASALIVATSGGTLEVTDSASPLFGATLEIPPGALAQDTQITIGIPSIEPTMGLLPTIGTTIELLPSGTLFSKEVILKLPYKESDIPANVPGEALEIQQLVMNQIETNQKELLWVSLKSSQVNTENKTLSVKLQHFSTYRASFYNISRKVYNVGLSVTGVPLFEINYYPDYPSYYKLFGNPDPRPRSVGGLNGYFPVRSASSYDPDHPPYIQDLGDFFLQALQEYEDRGYQVRRGSPYVVEVRDLSKINGEAFPADFNSIQTQMKMVFMAFPGKYFF